jgi:transcriptional regulator
MLTRPCWDPSSLDEIHTLIGAHPWGLLVSNGANGPLATNVAWMLDSSRGSYGVLRSHISRANAHSLTIQNDEVPVVAIFEGPHHYITASWYPERSMPSTVYYTAVHCYGKLVFQGDRELREALEDLTHASEAPFENGWKTSDIPESEITRRLSAILGFELVIGRIEAKFKLGQDEPKRDAMAVAQHLLTSDVESERSFGELVKRYNENRRD